MNYSRLKKEEILFQAGLRINNSLNDDAVKNAVALVGYTEEELNNGATLLNKAGVLYDLQLKEYGDVDAAQDKLKLSRKAVDKKYKVTLKIARIAFRKNVQAETTLELSGKRARTFSGWLKQSLNFYHAIIANNDWTAAMAKYGQTEEVLNSALQEIKEVSTAAENVKKEMGDAQNATEVRDLKFEELLVWLTDYDQLAEIAMTDSPQLLEKIGIVVKS